jgi:predicted transcriptional regulator
MRSGDSQMLTLELDPKLEERLARLAEKTNRSPGELANELLAQGLEDVSDGLIALERLEKPEGWYSLEDLEEGRDLEG